MLGEDRRSKTYRCYQSYLMLVLVVLLIVQVLTVITEVGVQISFLVSDAHPLYSWHLYYALAIVILFAVSIGLTSLGIRGTTNECQSSVLFFAFGVLITFGVKIILYVIVSDYRLAVILAINSMLNAVAIVYALLFARRMVAEVKKDTLTEVFE